MPSNSDRFAFCYPGELPLPCLLLCFQECSRWAELAEDWSSCIPIHKLMISYKLLMMPTKTASKKQLTTIIKIQYHSILPEDISWFSVRSIFYLVNILTLRLSLKTINSPFPPTPISAL